ncbi:prolipoprotein diacylglyceryl transferase [Candidatus Microgenomates bacterium]|nr:prolipoprotein diacylglyceryl transferase [Candidatus Microgenomates bacterium]
MLPVLIKFGPLTIYSFGVLAFISIILCSFIVWKLSRNRGLPEEKIFDTFLLTLFVGLIGARLGYVISNWNVFGVDLSRIVLTTHYPGMSFVWGMFSSIFGAFIIALAFGLNSFLVLDMFAYSLSWGIVLGLTGTFLDGSVKNIWIIPIFLVFAIIISTANYFVQKRVDLAIIGRRHGLLFSTYLIFLSGGLLMVGSVTGEKDKTLLLISLFIFIILFMVKFPASVLSQVREYLESKKTEAETRLKDLKREDPFEEDGRLLDRASEDSEVQSKANHERVTAMQQQLNMVLVQTRKALTKIKLGKYGICESCGKMIDTDRLAAMPSATLCLSCEKKRER